MFGFIKNHLSSLYKQFTEKARSLFNTNTVNNELYDELSRLLQSSDLGSTLTRTIVDSIKKQATEKNITNPQDLQPLLHQELLERVSALTIPSATPSIFVLVGINGSGKTTTAAKLALQMQNAGKKTLLIAGDTFRAAATEQLQVLGKKIGVDVFTSNTHKDPASLIFDGCKKYLDEQYDCLIIDTAGRLQTKSNLMDELSKIKRIITKQLPTHSIATLVTIDAMLGQNSLEQARLFHQATDLQGLIATKLDGSAKGGALIGIINELKLPIWFYTFGESLDQIATFDPEAFVRGFFE